MRRPFLKHIVAIALLATGCSALGASPTVTETPPATIAASPTSTPTPTPTATPRPSATPTQTPILPTSTWTPSPQLSSEETLALFDALFAGHGGCGLPCWWDITPGETTWDTLLAAFNTHGVPFHTTENSLVVDMHNNTIAFLRDNDLVQRIRITGSVNRESTVQWIMQSSPSDHMAQFSLTHVLTRYGAPSQVYMSGVGAGSHGPPGYYYLWIEYAKRGILLSYSGQATGSDSQYLICPEGEGVDQIELWLYPQGSRPFTETMEVLRVAFSGWTWDTWETVSRGASLETFYTNLKGPEFPGCIHVLYDQHYEIIQPADFSPVPMAKDETWLSTLLQANEACELPCWWGIMPGVTEVEKAQQMFLSQEKKPLTILPWSSEPETQYEVGVFGKHDPVPLDYVVSHRLVAKGNTVTRIHVAAGPPGWTSYSQHLAQDLHKYTLPAMLTRLGPPSHVEVFYHHPTCGETYRLHITYADLGMMASYSGVVQHGAESVTICPMTDNVIDIRMTLATPAYFTQTEPAWPDWNVEMDAPTFYQTCMSSAAPACLELPEQTKYTCP